MARYGKQFKDRLVSRLLPPESASIDEVSHSSGISVSTLERWRSEKMGEGETAVQWTAAARFDALLTTASMDEASKSAWCRSKGLYPQQLQQWAQSARAALDDGQDVERSATSRQDRRRIKELERDLRRKEKALAETAALLVLSKKLEAIFPKQVDEDE